MAINDALPLKAARRDAIVKLKSFWGFESKLQNDMPMLTQTQTWKSKPEVEFQHGGCLFSETGCSNISAVDWDISKKFSLQADYDLPN